MYGLGRLSDYIDKESDIFYLTPRKRSEIWLCRPVVPVAKAVNTEGKLWGMVFIFKNLDKVPTKVAINRKLINKSGVALVKQLANHRLSINPGYESQFASYLSAKLEPVKNAEIIPEASRVKIIET